MNIQFIRVSTLVFLLACIASWAYFHIGISEKEFALPSFSHLKVSGPIHLILMPAQEKVLLKADTRLLDQIKLQVEQDTLKVFPLVKVQRERVLSLQVPIAQLRSLHLAGPVEASCTFPLTLDSLSVLLSGSPELTLNSHTQYLEIRSLGSSNVFLSGTASLFLAQILGNGELMAYQLKTKNTQLKVKSSVYVSEGICRVWARDTLKLALAGSRKVYYRGKPKLLVTDTTPQAQVLPID